MRGASIFVAANWPLWMISGILHAFHHSGLICLIVLGEFFHAFVRRLAACVQVLRVSGLSSAFWTCLTGIEADFIQLRFAVSMLFCFMAHCVPPVPKLSSSSFR